MERHGCASSTRNLWRSLIRRRYLLKRAESCGKVDEAFELIASRTKEVRERYTASAIGFYTSTVVLRTDLAGAPTFHAHSCHVPTQN